MQVFIDEQAFQDLLEGSRRIKEFWIRRADLIAHDLLSQRKYPCNQQPET